MSSGKKMVADLLFWVQAICAVIFGVSQLLQILESTQGISITWFAFWEVFLVLNLGMAWRAHQNQPSRVTFQTLCTYLILIVMVSVVFFAALTRGSWNDNDTYTTILVVVGVVGTVVTAKVKKLQTSDPMVKASLAVFFKSVPQIMLGYNIYQVGGDGLAAITVVNGHFTILMRLGQLAFSIREAGWDRNRIGGAISEVANEVSWLVVTVVWFFR